MKKILFALFVYTLTFNDTFALNTSDIESDKASENSNIILSIFTLDTLTNIIFAVIAIVITLVIAKILNSKIG
jgi:hypothetical protein